MARKLEVEIIGDASSLERAFGRASKSGSSLGGTLKTLGKVAAVGVGAAFAGLAVVVKQGFDEIAEGQKVAAQTAAVLKSTGGIANVTAKEVANLASEQSKLTGIDDELIQSSENLLLTFKNVRNEVGANNDVFNQATAAALDLSTAGFGSVESASKMMGKALNDPIKGMTALGRAGVTFSEEQKKAIKALVETGDLLGAQKIILGEVQSQVGGSAKAYGETLPGQLNKLKNSFDDLAAGVAGVFLPALTSAIDFVNDTVIPALSKAGDAIKDFWKNMTGELGKAPDLRAKIRIVFSNVKELAGKFVDSVFDEIKGLLPQKPLILQPQTKVAVGGGGVDWNRIADDMVGALAAALEASTQLAMAFVDLIRTTVDQVPWVEIGKKAGPGFAVLVVTAFATIMDLGFWVRNWDLALAVALSVFGKGIPKFAAGATKAAAGPLLKIGDDFILFIASGIEKAFPRLAAVFTTVASRAFTVLLAGFVTGVRKIEDFIHNQFARLGGILGNVLKAGFIYAGINAILGLLQGLVQGIPKVSALIRGLEGQVKGWFGNAASWLYNQGIALIQGFWNGVSSKLGWLKGKIEAGLGFVKNLNPFSTVEEGGAKYIGKPLAEGAIKGWLDGSKELPAKMSETLRNSVTKAAEAITASKDAFASAFGELASAGLSAFDKITQEFETKTERLIRKQDEAIAKQERLAARVSAQEELTQAQVAFETVDITDPAAIQAAQDAILAASQKLADANLAIQRAANEKKAANERAEYEASRERQRLNLEKQLARLQQNYLNQEISTKEFHGRLIGIFKSFEVPLGKAANRLGAALADGLNTSFKGVDQAARNLANTIVKRFSEITVKVNIELQDIRGGRGAAGKPEEPRQHGGPVRAGSPYLVGEAGPELFIPRNSGKIVPNGNGAAMAGGGIVNLNFYGPTVGTSREFEDTVRRAIYNVSRRNPGSGL